TKRGAVAPLSIGSPAVLLGPSMGLAPAGRRRGRRRSKRHPAVLVIHQEAAQLLAAARVAQLAQRLRLDLADALARDIELLADLFERVVGIHVDAEAHAQH